VLTVYNRASFNEKAEIDMSNIKWPDSIESLKAVELIDIYKIKAQALKSNFLI